MINFMFLQGRPNGQLPKRNDRRSSSVKRTITSHVVLKSENFSFPSIVPRPNMLLTLTKRAEKFVPVQANCLNPVLNEFVAGVVSRLKLSLQTHALGMYIYYGVALRKIGYSSNQLLYASVSLVLASKMVERDTHIVNMSALRKAACSYIPREEYARAQRNILLALDYNLSIQTFVGFVSYYLWKGILFQSEKNYQNSQLNALEQGILNRCASYIRSGQFLCYKPERLAAFIVYNARKDVGLPGWLREIQAITKLSATDVQTILSEVKDIEKTTSLPLTISSSNSLKPRELILKKKIEVESLNSSPKNGVERQGRRLFGFASTNMLAAMRTSKSVATLHQ